MPPAPPQQQPGMPATPVEAMNKALAQRGQEMAGDMIGRQFRSTLKGYLPKVLWPLIPGEGGSVQDKMKEALKKWFWGVVGGIIFSIIFFLVFAVVIVIVLGIVVYAVLTSM